MKGAVLADEHTAIDGHNVVLREGFLQLATSEIVILWLTIGGKKYGLVDDEEIGICGRQTVTIVGVEDRRWQRERKKSPLLTSPKGEKAFQLRFHGGEGFVVLIGWVCATDVGNGVVGAKAGEGIDVTVGVVAGEVAVVEPKDAVGMEITQQTFLNLVAGEVGVAVGREEALAGRQQRALAVALYAAAFEDKVKMGLITSLNDW